MKRLSDLLSFLSVKNTRKLCIIPHQHPDADAIGSALALSRYLAKKGHHTAIISPNAYPDFLDWMVRAGEVIVWSEQTAQAQQFLRDCEGILFVDLSSTKRLGSELAAFITPLNATKIIMDHHPQAENFSDYSLWSSRAAATAQIVYDFVCMDGGTHLLDKAIAECLYAGLMTDTGSFRFSSVTSRTHYITARLLAYGVDPENVNRHLYSSYSADRMRFIGYALSKCLHVHPEWHTSYFLLKEQDIKPFKPRRGDTEGLVNMGLAIKGIEICALLSEQSDGVKLSFRSKGTFAVNELARKHFNGGGHRNAAGGFVKEDIQSVANKFKSILPNYQQAFDPPPPQPKA